MLARWAPSFPLRKYTIYFKMCPCQVLLIWQGRIFGCSSCLSRWRSSAIASQPQGNQDWCLYDSWFARLPGIEFLLAGFCIFWFNWLRELQPMACQLVDCRGWAQPYKNELILARSSNLSFEAFACSQYEHIALSGGCNWFKSSCSAIVCTLDS